MKRILFYSPYGHWYLHTLYEITIAHSLMLRGAEVKFVCCDGLYSDCDIFWENTKPRNEYSCQECMDRTQKTFESLKMPFEWLSKYLDPQAKETAEKWAQSLSDNDLTDAVYNGRPLGEWVNSSVHSHFRMKELNTSDPKINTTYRSYLYSAAVALNGLNNLLADYQPDVLFLLNGRFSNLRVALESAKQRSIRTITHERGRTDNSLYIVDGATAHSFEAFNESYNNYKDIPLNTAQLQEVENLLIDREKGKNTGWKSFVTQSSGTSDVVRQLQLPDKKEVITLFTSSLDETPVEQGWEYIIEPFEWIQRTIDYFSRRKDYYLIIRMHPNTSGITGSDTQSIERINRIISAGLPDNVKIVKWDERIDSYRLIELSRACIVYRSRIGLEAAAKAKPVLYCAKGPFYGRNFALNLPDSGRYESCLDTLLTEGPSVERLRAAYRFTYHYFIRYNIPFPLVSVIKTHNALINYTTTAQLLPGKDAYLDRICAFLLSDEPLYPAPKPSEINYLPTEEDIFLEEKKMKIEESREPLKIAFVARTSEIFAGKADGQKQRRCGQSHIEAGFGRTTPAAEIAAVRSRNEFLEVPLNTESEEKMKHTLSKAAVSVIIPCYNYGRYLAEAVDSVLNQTCQGLEAIEIIIVNDGSTDETKQVAERLIAEHPEHRIHLINQANSGQPAIARNNAIAEATGEYILPLDADDKLAPQAIESYLRTARDYPNQPVVVFGWLQRFGVEKTVWKTRPFSPDQLLHRMKLPYCSMYHRSVWQRQNGYSTNVPGYEDWDFWIGALETGTRFINIPLATTFYRRTGTSSLIDSARQRHEWLIVGIISNHPNAFEKEQLLWAADYLKCSPQPPEKRQIHGQNDRYPRVSAMLIADYPELYTPQEIAWSKDVLSRHLAEENNAQAPKLSVVLTTFNRPRLLEKTLAGFARQTTPGEDFEVIVVDDGSEPPAREVAEKFRSSINILYLRQQNCGPAAARNNGIRAAKGHIILFSDDDDVPGPELIAEHLRSHKEHPDERVAVLGHLEWHKDLEISPLMHYITGPGGEYFGYEKMQDGRFYNVWKWWVGLISAKLSLLKSVEGPFDGRLHFGYEDTELACRLLNRDVRILYNAGAKSYIIRAVDFEVFCRRRYKQGQSLYHVAATHPEIIIPRYNLQDADELYHSKYAPFLEQWCSKVAGFEPLLNDANGLQGPQRDEFIKLLYMVYGECFKGYWLKGYIEQKQAAESGKISPSSPADTRAVVFSDNVESDCNRANMPHTSEPLRITFLSTNTPGFDIGSSNVRIYHILKILTQAGEKIDYLYFNQYEDDQRYKQHFCDSVNFVRIPADAEGIIKYFQHHKDLKMDCLWITNLWSVNYLALALYLTNQIKSGQPQVKVIIDTMDFHYKKLMRKFNVSNDSNDLSAAEEMLKFEEKLYPLADAVLTVTEDEKRDILKNISPAPNVIVVPNIHRIPPQAPDLQQREDICFIGNPKTNHNADAIRWFVKEVFPLIRQKALQLRFHILGFGAETFRAEFETAPNVKVIGYVADAESAVAGYRLFVCPLTYGSGMKGKLGTAAAAGTPIVTTTIGAEGFGFIDGQNCFIADGAEEFAERCLYLLSDVSLWRQFSTKAKELVAENFSIKAASEKIYSLLHSDAAYKSTSKATSSPAEIQAASDCDSAAQVQSKPKVSIITSCYNCEKFLPECLASIKNQTMQQWELLLIDDASTDNTKKIIEEYAQTDRRIKPYYFQENKGPYIRRNFAIERADSDFIVIQDADDIMAPNKLEVLYRHINSDERLGITGAFYHSFLNEFRGLQYTDKAELPRKHNDIVAGFSSFQHAMSHGSAIIRKELFDAIGPYDTNPFGSDTFWFAKAAEYSKHNTALRFENIGEYLTLVRRHSDSQTQTLPAFDPRSRRAKYRLYCANKLQKTMQTIKGSPNTDVKAALKDCACSDFIDKFGHLFEKWEGQGLKDKTTEGLLGWAVSSFNTRKYITCITTLNGMEIMSPGIAKKFKNYYLLKAMAYFAIDMKPQGTELLNTEIQNHDNEAAKKFVSDYLENNQNIDIQKWCLENSKVYELLMIDTESSSKQKTRTVDDQDKSARRTDQVHGQQTSPCEQTGPLVSIVMPSYNAEKYIAEAIKSALGQTYKNFELIVANDGSTDNTKNIAIGFKDKRIKHFYQENRGAYSARNLGLKNAGGDFIVPLDTDDMITPDFIAAHLEEFEKHPDADLIYCDDYLIEPDCEPIRVIKRPQYTKREHLIRDLFRRGFPIVPFRTCIRKSVFEKIGLFDERFRTAMDYDMMRRFAAHGLKAHHLGRPLYLRRMTSEGLSRVISKEKGRVNFEVIRRFTETFRYDELFPDVKWDNIEPQKRQLHAKCLTAVTYLAMGQFYIDKNVHIYAEIAFENAISELNDCLKTDPGNPQVEKLLQKCELARLKCSQPMQAPAL